MPIRSASPLGGSPNSSTHSTIFDRVSPSTKSSPRPESPRPSVAAHKRAVSESSRRFRGAFSRAQLIAPLSLWIALSSAGCVDLTPPGKYAFSTHPKALAVEEAAPGMVSPATSRRPVTLWSARWTPTSRQSTSPPGPYRHRTHRSSMLKRTRGREERRASMRARAWTRRAHPASTQEAQAAVHWAPADTRVETRERQVVWAPAAARPQAREERPKVAQAARAALRWAPGGELQRSEGQAQVGRRALGVSAEWAGAPRSPPVRV